MSVRLFEVGGCVRDRVLGLKPKDIDYSVEAKDFDTMLEFIKARGKVWLSTPEYFTVRAKIDGVDADFVLCRKESGYSDGRRPDVVEVGTIFDDLARRDFTMNAMAINVDTGERLDPFDGETDLRNGLIRCVGKTVDRFTEDALRMIRAMRFSLTKKMMLDDEIVACLSDPSMMEILASVKLDRKRDELIAMLFI